MISAFVNFRKKMTKYTFFRAPLPYLLHILYKTFTYVKHYLFLSPAFDTPIINSVSATESRANLIFVKYA